MVTGAGVPPLEEEVLLAPLEVLLLAPEDVLLAPLEVLLDVLLAPLEVLLDVLLAPLEVLLDVLLAPLEVLLDVLLDGVLEWSLPPPQPTMTKPAHAARAMLRVELTLRLNG